tara:strand:- start:19107 stop:19889 length:783 start_codon:yes stop_codon:yes gene_type:complete
MKSLSIVLIIIFFSLFSFAQSIVNTEKLFNDNEDGFATAAELIGSAISGNANVSLVEYSMNFRYRWKKNNLKLLTGGEFIREDQTDVSNNLFSQLRYNYHFNSKSRFVGLYQIQYNKVLLLNRRQILGVGLRRRLIEKGSDSTNRFKSDLTIGIMQEEEQLNSETLQIDEKNYTNYTRSMLSMVISIEISENFTFINTTYFQQYLNNLTDFRLFNEVNLIFAINKWMSLSCDFEFRHDSEPPTSLKNNDFNTNLGLLFNL